MTTATKHAALTRGAALYVRVSTADRGQTVKVSAAEVSEIRRVAASDAGQARSAGHSGKRYW